VVLKHKYVIGRSHKAANISASRMTLKRRRGNPQVEPKPGKMSTAELIWPRAYMA